MNHEEEERGDHVGERQPRNGDGNARRYSEKIGQAVADAADEQAYCRTHQNFPRCSAAFHLQGRNVRKPSVIALHNTA